MFSSARNTPMPPTDSMHGNTCIRRGGSLFTKLFMVLLLTGICINIVVAGFIANMFRNPERHPFFRLFPQFVSYIADDLGSPPDRGKAARIASQTGLSIRYESPDGGWTTDAPPDHMPPAQHLKLRRWVEDPRFQLGWRHGIRVIAIDMPRGRLIVEHRMHRADEMFETGFIVMLIALLSIIVASSFLVLRWILKPVRQLTTGVHEVGSGNLDYTVPVKSGDEFGELTDAFNAMTGRIRDMLASRERLILDVSHELRSPLTRMKVALEFLPDDRTRESLRQDVSEMESMVTEVLEAARLKSGSGQPKIRAVNLADIATRVASEFDAEKHEAAIVNAEGAATVQADPDLIARVLRNLVRNALAHSGQCGEPVKITFADLPDYALLRVTDSGSGIPAADLPHIFEPFYRADRSRSRHTGGYGLGLSLCRTIMEAHGGRIEAESEPGKTTTFALYFRK
jgi:signal transduction histidine kinase